YQFAHKERDVESGLDYVAARYYDATLGRFASVEPMALQGTDIRKPSLKLNPYAYATNNPINFVDPTGHDDTPLNQKVTPDARSQAGGKPVGHGECWDLGELALKAAGAQTSTDLTPNFRADSDFVWGTPVKDLKDVEPGDILQFRDHVVTVTTKTEYKSESGAWWMTETKTTYRRQGQTRPDGTRPGHTAIVNGKVDEQGRVQILEQHVGKKEQVYSNTLYTRNTQTVVNDTLDSAKSAHDGKTYSNVQV